MKTHCIWECEIEFLAQQWQPLFIKEVMAHYHKRKDALMSAKTAFADTYERYFLNPGAEGSHQ